MSRSKIIVLGSINIDLVIRSPRLPIPGETVLGGEFYTAQGGKGANLAVAAARAGRSPVVFIAAVGDDQFGTDARAQLARENLVLDFVTSVPDQPTGAALILVDHAGENLISVASGANSRLLPEDVDAVPVKVFKEARVFAACLESPLETVRHALRRAKHAGALTLLNPAPANLEIAQPDWMELVDVLTPNASEAELLTGLRPGDASTAEQVARKLRDLGCRNVVITLGPRGCLVVDTQGNATEIAGLSVPSIDATAAGDAFNGALAVALSEGSSLVQAARWATRAAALSTTRRGAQPSLATREEIGEWGE